MYVLSCFVGLSEGQGDGPWHPTPTTTPLLTPVSSPAGVFSGSLELATTTLGFDFMSGSQQKVERHCHAGEQALLLLIETVCREAGSSFCCAGSSSNMLSNMTPPRPQNRVMSLDNSQGKPKRHVWQISFICRCGIGFPPSLRLMKQILKDDIQHRPKTANRVPHEEGRRIPWRWLHQGRASAEQE